MSVSQARSKFKGVVVPMATPATSAGDVDLDAAARIVDHLLQGGVDGIFVLGTTGEGASVPPSQKCQLVQATASHVQGRAVVYAGISGNCWQESVEFSKAFAEAGASAVVAHPATYYAVDDGDLIHYFRSLADASPVPLMLYDIPKTTHLSIKVPVVESLMAHENIAGIKDSSGDADRVRQLLALRGDSTDFTIQLGAGKLFAELLRCGVDALVPSTGNLLPDLFHTMFLAALTKDWETVDRLQKEANESSDIYQEGRLLGQSLVALKALMAGKGLCSATMFPPLRAEQA